MVASSTLRSLPSDHLTNVFIHLALASILLLLLPLINILSRSPRKSLSRRSYGIDTLPEELLTNILLRLPAESLLRCKSVCKELHAIISTPTFINMHLNNQTNLTRLVLYYHGPVCQGGDLYSICSSYFLDQTTFQRHEVPDHLLLWGEITYFRGPCNGIFCIYITENRFALWNPTTRKLRLIQCCPSHIFDDVGFGIDPLTGDFKIVLIRAEWGISPCFAVYTSSSDSWKYLEQESIRHPFPAFITNMVPGNNAYYKGFYYWIKQNGIECTILAFDMHNEIFEESSMPPDIDGSRKAFHLFNDSLALVSHDRCIKHTPFEIWLMEGKGQWTNYLSVYLPFECYWSYGFWGANKILIYIYLENRERLMLCDLDSNSGKHVKVENTVMFSTILPIFYKESLISLKDEQKGIKEYDIRSAEALEFMCYEGPKTKLRFFEFREGATPFDESCSE